MGKAHGVEGGRPSQEDAEVECVGCRQKLPLQAFDAERLSIWKRNRDITKNNEMQSLLGQVTGWREQCSGKDMEAKFVQAQRMQQ